MQVWVNAEMGHVSVRDITYPYLSPFLPYFKVFVFTVRIVLRMTHPWVNVNVIVGCDWACMCMSASLQQAKAVKAEDVGLSYLHHHSQEGASLPLEPHWTFFSFTGGEGSFSFTGGEGSRC